MNDLIFKHLKFDQNSPLKKSGIQVTQKSDSQVRVTSYKL
ncbi:MAG: hypothetical protein BMS9Abin13_584 [Patescibacteria group bacterium]|nr:MAG: hypothetical protein BMS9Abin13_584 [Patescibacteria group bacterium]